MNIRVPSNLMLKNVHFQTISSRALSSIATYKFLYAALQLLALYESRNPTAVSLKSNSKDPNHLSLIDFKRYLKIIIDKNISK